jgi:hypothetical protein
MWDQWMVGADLHGLWCDGLLLHRDLKGEASSPVVHQLGRKQVTTLINENLQ